MLQIPQTDNQPTRHRNEEDGSCKETPHENPKSRISRSFVCLYVYLFLLGVHLIDVGPVAQSV
jgi:hypothetical protein